MAREVIFLGTGTFYKAKKTEHNTSGVKSKTSEVLIVSVTPFFLEKEVAWFSQHIDSIKHARSRQGFWRTNTLLLEEGVSLPPTLLLERLSVLGYERTEIVVSQGEFSRHGGFFTVFPINALRKYRIEFFGNQIERIAPLHEEKTELLRPKKGLRELEAIKPDDYVVHEDHGVGIFRGFTQKIERREYTVSLERATAQKEPWYVVVEYAPPRAGEHADRLLVPISQAKKITPYYGFEKPTIHRLGGGLWFKTKKKIKEEVIALARELLTLYARREIAARAPYPYNGTTERMFASGFPYVETEDQINAFEDIHRDLSASQPMDRILIGDVGFGKTEIALRAAFRVIIAEKQVLFLAPTTVLAWQHYYMCRERFQNFPINVALISRLTSKKDLKKSLVEISSGKADMVIGTHRLLSSDVKFKNLGLLIIDEEQRFGVQQKEALKNLRPSLDVLSLSATPIPRTMYLALSKIRSFSVVRTPPPGRLPIKTFIVPFSATIIKEAVSAELKRKGQVFFLHNRVETMEIRRKELASLIPHAKIAVVHGKLPEKDLLRVMEGFRKGTIDVLVATTIIENGLDLSNVNTLIVASSTRLGLGEAYQLRGRIGRGERQAYAYFLYQPQTLSEDARRRLEALREANYLGAGYKIALKDLEIRGAGNILGREQSGAINAVGLNFYMQMLSHAVEGLTVGDEFQKKKE